MSKKVFEHHPATYLYEKIDKGVYLIQWIKGYARTKQEIDLIKCPAGRTLKRG